MVSVEGSGTTSAWADPVADWKVPVRGLLADSVLAKLDNERRNEVLTTTPIKLPAENLRTLHGECCSMFDMAHRLGVELRTFGESEAAQRYAREVVEVFDRMSMAGLRDLAEAAADKPPIPEPIRAYAPVVDEMEELRQDVKTKRKADAARLREGAK